MAYSTVFEEIKHVSYRFFDVTWDPVLSGQLSRPESDGEGDSGSKTAWNSLFALIFHRDHLLLTPLLMPHL